MLFNETKIILDLCGGTGAWSKPYREAGYDVRLVTLPEQDVTDYIPPDNVYGILAAPPCDQLTLARNRYNNDPNVSPRDLIKAMIPVNACIRIVWQCERDGNLKFWGMENPIGLLSNYLKMKPAFIFHPWHFGEPYTKITGIWGKFNLPKRKYARITDVMSVKTAKKSKQNIRRLPSGSEITSGGQAERRAITPAGFALAFFEANQ
jgi:hypothetical protein